MHSSSLVLQILTVDAIEEAEHPGSRTTHCSRRKRVSMSWPCFSRTLSCWQLSGCVCVSAGASPWSALAPDALQNGDPRRPRSSSDRRRPRRVITPIKLQSICRETSFLIVRQNAAVPVSPWNRWTAILRRDQSNRDHTACAIDFVLSRLPHSLAARTKIDSCRLPRCMASLCHTNYFSGLTLNQPEIRGGTGTLERFTLRA